MPRRTDLNKVLVIGSGPIVIGQAAEFDYAGTQACKSLREEGIEVILVNSNPATIMTDLNIADKVYMEPLTVESISAIIEIERPDGILPTLGGQTGLNLAVELWESGVLGKFDVTLLGTSVETIKKGEDRELFKRTMLELGEPVPPSAITSTMDETLSFAEKVGYPVIVRPAYTLGGSGGGIAESEGQLREIAARGFKASRIHQLLIERSVAGWKEIEFEVMRDSANSCITVCSMENFDPIGIHTGDSIVIAPSQTLTDREYQMLRNASLRIIRALGVEGGCNIQFALNPLSFEYNVIEVNPRVSRSSALASKATGYPIAKVAAKIAIGMTLDEIPNSVTGKTCACFEPSIDYVVVKIPRWPFDKFSTANRMLGTQMKATGEVMAIERNLESALMKAVRSLEIGVTGLRFKGVADWSDERILFHLKEASDERLFVIAEALRRGISLERIFAITKIDNFFLEKLNRIISIEKCLADLTKFSDEQDIKDTISEAKAMNISDAYCAELAGVDEAHYRGLRKKYGIDPVYKIVDTCAAEFDALTPYFYSTYEAFDESRVTAGKKAVVLGSGPIRIGQGIEFDYCSVHSAWALREAGYESIIVNNNPETVSTDFDTSDKLYFEPLTFEDTMNVIESQGVDGVIVQFGGQTAIGLAEELNNAGVRILGSPVDAIDKAEDRDRFEKLCTALRIPQTEGRAASSVMEAMGIAQKVGFPVVVRPSYVLGGRAMEIVHNESELFEYMTLAAQVSPKHPILVDHYLEGREVEVDAICDGKDVLIPGIMEHIERAGVHSGDSMAVFPPQRMTEKELDAVVRYTTSLALGLGIKGLMNVQYVIYNGKVYVLEVNPRASRTVPILSKVTGVPMVNIATKICLGDTLAGLGYRSGLLEPPPFVAVKAPVFSFEKLTEVDVFLGPEMKSTGEVMGVGRTYIGALYKALVAAGFSIPNGGKILASIADKDKAEAVGILTELAGMGFSITATKDTASVLRDAGLAVETVYSYGEGHPDVVDLIRQGEVDLVINTPTKGKIPGTTGFRVRRASVEYKVPCLTSLDTAAALVEAIKSIQSGKTYTPVALNEFVPQ